jgi:hypothetical protein
LHLEGSLVDHARGHHHNSKIPRNEDVKGEKELITSYHQISI